MLIAILRGGGKLEVRFVFLNDLGQGSSQVEDEKTFLDLYAGDLPFETLVEDGGGKGPRGLRPFAEEIEFLPAEFPARVHGSG